MVGNKYRLWTEEDDRRLLELRAAGRSTISISAALRRSKGAVISRIGLLKARQIPTAVPPKETAPAPRGDVR